MQQTFFNQRKKKENRDGDNLKDDESTNKYILTSGPIKIAKKSREGGKYPFNVYSWVEAANLKL